LRALNTSIGRNARMPWATILLMVALVPSCGFPSHTFRDEDCFNGKDDNGDGLIDCADPTCSLQVSCASLPSADWSGPVVIWRGKGTDVPPSCADSGYPVDTFQSPLFNGQDPGHAAADQCPACNCAGPPSPNSAHCETHLKFYTDDQCQSSISPDNSPGYLVREACTTVQTQSTAAKFYTADSPNIVYDNNICTAQPSAPTQFTRMFWESALWACSPSSPHVFSSCSYPSMCLPHPQAAFDQAVCVYKAVDATMFPGPSFCPANFPQELVYYQSHDTRDCTKCSCQPSGLSCQVSNTGDIVGDFGASNNDCTGPGLKAIGIPPGCVPVSEPWTGSTHAKLHNTAVVAAASACSPIQSQFSGNVVKGQAVSFCCRSL
jgi:hypothetical protein